MARLVAFLHLFLINCDEVFYQVVLSECEQALMHFISREVAPC